MSSCTPRHSSCIGSMHCWRFEITATETPPICSRAEGPMAAEVPLSRPRRPMMAPSDKASTLAWASKGCERESSSALLNFALKLAPMPWRCASPASASSLKTPSTAPCTSAAIRACSRWLVLPREPPPGLSPTSANSTAGSAGSAPAALANATASPREVIVLRKRFRIDQVNSANSLASAAAAERLPLRAVTITL